MPWIIGIDEAGYGPNLGPLVMTAVACQVPEAMANADLWQVLSSAVRRTADPSDDRLLVADSKEVYSTARGLHGLEIGVLPLLPPTAASPLSSLIENLCPTSAAELRCECWHTGASQLPLEVAPAELAAMTERLQKVCKDNEVAWAAVRSVLVCPKRFNDLVEQWGSKGAVLGHGLSELVRYALAVSANDSVSFFIDKHGGRNTYAAMLQNAVPDSFVMAHEEGLARSVYSILGQEREVRLTFQPRADAEHFCVALASMVSKYLREVLMLEFNRFWRDQVPGLKPTAGYPADALRFFQAIWPVAQRLGLSEAALWRRK